MTLSFGFLLVKVRRGCLGFPCVSNVPLASLLVVSALALVMS
jgi:hypothetical protein